MEINLNSIQSASPTSTNSQAGVAAPQTEGQKADLLAQRVVSAQESANLENNARNVEEKRFDAIRSRAAQFVGGQNTFLNDIKFTIYGDSPINSGLNEYVIRFTDLGTGKIEVKTERELFAEVDGGEIVNGKI